MLSESILDGFRHLCYSVQVAQNSTLCLNSALKVHDFATLLI